MPLGLCLPWSTLGDRGAGLEGTSGWEACDVLVTTLYCTLNKPCKLWVTLHFYTKWVSLNVQVSTERPP